VVVFLGINKGEHAQNPNVIKTENTYITKKRKHKVIEGILECKSEGVGSLEVR